MLHNLTCIIIDDEPKAIELLKERLGILFPGISIKGTYTDWKKGIEALKTTPVDILFLDISMPEKTGLDMLKLFQSTPFQTIFITAHSEFAVQAIKLSAAGYVLKPIDDYELSFAVNKAIEKINEKSQVVTNAQAVSSANNNTNAVKIGVPNIKGIDYLRADEILYFESVNKYTKVVTKEYSIMSSYNLGEFKKIIDLNIFFQVHRSYIVNLEYVKRYETTGCIVMEDNTQIPISKTVKNEFLASFGKISKTAGFKHKDID